MLGIRVMSVTMADALYGLLVQYLPQTEEHLDASQPLASKYLSRLLSLHLVDLSTTESQSIEQSSHSNLVSIQALSSRSHKASTAASDHLAILSEALPQVSSSVNGIRNAVPQLDSSAVQFAGSYSKSKEDNVALKNRKESMLLARQADRLQDILELPSLLSAAIASAGSGTAGSTNYSQALDLFAHIKRLQVLYPDSQLVKSVLVEAEQAMKEMVTNLVAILRGQNIRLAAAIRTIGWLRRVVPELGTAIQGANNGVEQATTGQGEGHFGALFLCARLCTFLNMTEALAPLRELADQETAQRGQGPQVRPEPVRRASTMGYSAQGQQSERYLKRYIEIFREQSFATISMYRNIFPVAADESSSEPLQLPSAVVGFPLHLVGIFMETLRTYLPNIHDVATRESILMQVLYAANSLGRLGANFTMMIALLDEETGEPELATTVAKEDDEKQETPYDEPEWSRVIKKHRVQTARLEALAAGQDETIGRKGLADVAVK